MQQILYLGPKPVLRILGPASGSSLRMFVDGKTYELAQKSRKPNHALSKKLKAHRNIIEAALEQAKSYLVLLFHNYGDVFSSLETASSAPSGAS